jgi:hypothetical protein
MGKPSAQQLPKQGLNTLQKLVYSTLNLYSLLLSHGGGLAAQRSVDV